MIIYTDGACSSTDKTGGWATVIVTPQQILQINDANVHINPCDGGVVLSGNAVATTNNIMELTAVIYAMKAILASDEETSHTIYTDSAYVANCIKNRWYEKWQHNGWMTANRQPVANKELWQELLNLYNTAKKHGHIIGFVLVKGHSDDFYNDVADSCAVSERLALRR